MRRSIQSVALSILLLTALLLVLPGSVSQRKSLAMDESSLNLGTEKHATMPGLPTMPAEELAEKEILLVTQKVPQFHVVDLPTSGDKVLTLTDSLTVDDLRNVKIDDDPPQWVGPGNITEMKNEPFVATDIEPFQFKYFTITWDYRGPYYTGKASMYAALHGFNTIFPHLVVTSTQKPTGVYVTELTRIPITPLTGLLWQGFVWDRSPDGFMQLIGVESGRFDKLPDRAELVRILTSTITVDASQVQLTQRAEPTYTNYLYLVPNMEFPAIPLDSIPQDWYPKFTLPVREFEDKYYNGFINSILATAEVAHIKGWKLVGIYGWHPAQGAFDELEPHRFPEYLNRVNEQWNRYGKSIYRDNAIDFINVPVYPMAWNDPVGSNKNNLVAYTLANTDLNIKLGKELVQHEGVTAKPVLTWFSHLIFRLFDAKNVSESSVAWWRDQPIRDEDATAMIAMNFFTGADGLVLWSWSPTIGYSETVSSYVEMTDPLDAVVLRTKWDYTVKSDFTLPPPTIAPIPRTPCTQVVTEVKRYDAVHILKIDTGKNEVWFQWIQKYCGYSDDNHILPAKVRYGVNFNWKPGDSEAELTYPVYVMKMDALAKHLRPRSSSVAGIIEGLAVVKPFEYSLRHGSVMLDFPAVTDVTNQCWFWDKWWLTNTITNYESGVRPFSPALTQFQCRLPTVRRVKIGNYHILITYDPRWEEFKNSPRQIVLPEFDGKPFTLTLPADQQTRIFVVRDADVDLAPVALPLGCPNTRKCLGISVKNTGTTTAPASRATVKYNDSLGNQFLDALLQNGLSLQIPSLPPGQSVLLRLIQPAHLENNCLHIMVIVDSGDQIAETNEANNEAEFCIWGHNSLH